MTARVVDSSLRPARWPAGRLVHLARPDWRLGHPKPICRQGSLTWNARGEWVAVDTPVTCRKCLRMDIRP